MSTLACLAAGFEVVARHPMIIIVPILLDLFLWLGPRLSISPIVTAAEGLFKASFMASEVLSSEAEETYVLISQTFDQLAEQFNLFTSLEPAPLLGVPTLMATRMSIDQPLGPRVEIVVGSAFSLMGWVLLLTLLGLVLSAFYLRMIGRRVIKETEVPFAGPGGVIQLWGQLLLFSLIVLVILFMFSMTAAALVAFASLISFGIAGFVITLLFSFVIFIGFHLTFAVPGLVQLRRSPFRAIQESLLITRGDFLNATFLILLILVISSGFNVVWSLPDTGNWTNLIGIAGHAFVSTALTAALFIFYQERLNFMSMLQEAQTAQEKAAHPVAGE